MSSCHPAAGLKKKWKEVILKIIKLISFPDSPNDVPVIQFCVHDRRNNPELKPAGAFLLKDFSLTACKGNYLLLNVTKGSVPLDSHKQAFLFFDMLGKIHLTS